MHPPFGGVACWFSITREAENMKIEISNTHIKLTPQTSDDLVKIHNAQYRGIQATQLVGKLPDEAEFLLTLGPDYLAPK